MSVSRRFVLKGIAMSGIAGLTMGGSLRALATTINGVIADQPIVALIKEGAAELAFVHGAMAASSSQLQVQRVSCDLAFMLDIERQMLSSHSMRIIGLLDDASATLFMDMARSAGARVQWLGQHTAEAGLSHHHLLTTDIADGCFRQLSRQLHACGASFSLHEERFNGSVVPRQLVVEPTRSDRQSTQWATSIGYLLASLGTRPALTTPLAPTASTPVTGSFVSFSIET